MSTLLTILIATQGFTCLTETKPANVVDCLSTKAHEFVVTLDVGTLDIGALDVVTVDVETLDVKTLDKDYDQSSQYEDMDRLCPHCKTIRLLKIKENK